VDEWWTATDDGLIVRVHVVPNARRTEVVHVTSSRLRLKLAAPAVDNKANEEAIRFFAATFGVRKQDVRLVIGGRSRDKTFRIAGVDALPESLSR
jgi:uncharacterized protein (TIGR00251 family)